ncbi:hypothetical protein [Culturomica massiliensis]|uniref:hypothetical protein n=1 Tax=Culturomica massiliensis TaxID=1841857 RepID=UPI000839A69B|nr:hypothetical protein [Culturomica massiliensis]
MDKNTEQWNEINELLSKNGAHLNVLEEEIDIEIQREYFNLAHSITKKPRKFKQLCKKYTENINQLFDENIPEKQKKEMLTVLATLDDISIYRAIENFSKQDTPLKSWATVALQQSRMLIQSNLLEDPEIFISTGLGGRGNLLRYFCVFLNRQKENSLEEFQQKIVRNETEAALSPLKGELEQIHFSTGYSTFTVLIPLNADLKILFSGIVEECNLYGNFLHENMIITNVKKLSDEEIQSLLKKK